MLFDKSFRQQETSLDQDLPITTQSLCPVCCKILEANLYEHQNQIWMYKYCPEHGEYNELICSDKDFFIKRRKTHYEQPSGVKTPHTKTQNNCPLDCGLCPQHKSCPCMVNIDLTNRCNLNCPICFANANATGKVCEINLKQLDMMLDKAMDIKPHPPISIQYAGGEPTIHPDFVQAVKMAKDKGFIDVQAASNGLRFAKSKTFTEECAQAGLDVVYLQFDGMTDDIYKQSRGRPLWETKMQAIENLKEAGIMVTLVPTVVTGLNDHQMGDILKYAIQNTDVITAVSFQPVSLTGRIDETKRQEIRYTMADMARDLQNQTNGIVNMYEDWYPYSIINPISRLMEAITGTPKVRFNCHAHCGVATYLLVDREKKTAVPITRFFDLEKAMQDLNQEAEAIENHPWRKRLTKIQIMRKLKKHFKPEKAPEGLEFDHMVDFVNKMIESGDEENRPKKQRGHVYHVMGEKFDLLLLTAMHFQDNYNFELDRVQHCVIHYAAPDGKFYPFCTWNSGPCHRYKIEEAFSRPLKKEEQKN